MFEMRLNNLHRTRETAFGLHLSISLQITPREDLFVLSCLIPSNISCSRKSLSNGPVLPFKSFSILTNLLLILFVDFPPELLFNKVLKYAFQVFEWILFEFVSLKRALTEVQNKL